MASLFGIDTRGLTAVRIGLAVIILVEIILEPPAIALTGPIGLARILVVPAALALLVGYRTRLATVATWVTYSLPLRADLLDPAGSVHLGNYVLALALFWCMFLPLGEHLSIDSADSRSGPTRFLSIAGAGLLIQLFIIYFWAGVTKDLQEWVFDATALHTVLGHPDHGTRLGEALTAFPIALAVASVVTMALEILGPILLFAPRRGLNKRRVVLPVAFILFHTGMALFMTLGIFPYVMIVVWLVFLPGSMWDRLPGRVESAVDNVDGHRLRNTVAGTALAYIWLSSIVTWIYFPAQEGLPGFIQGVGRHLMLYQQWAMFSLPSSL